MDDATQQPLGPQAPAASSVPTTPTAAVATTTAAPQPVAQRRSLRAQIDAHVRAQWIVTITLLVALAALYVFGHRPAAKRAALLGAELDTYRGELEAAAERSRDLQAVEAEVQRLGARMERFYKMLPSMLDYWAETGEALDDIVVHVLILEAGHHFGLSDEDMERIEASVE